jgi:RNA polymerase sigma-70 factor (ECF subfamily)
MTEQDEDIVRRIRGGEVRAYSILVDRYKERAMTLACRLLRNRHEAEELVQDAFVRAYRGLDRYRGDARFGTWFYRILYNVCMSAIRSHRQDPEAINLEEELPRLECSASGEGQTQLEELETRDVHAIIKAELERLPITYRAAMALFYLDDMGYEEIAGVLGSPLGTVKTTLFRGRELLRRRVLAVLKKEAVAA